jgi:hypothetical protein
LGQAVVNPQCRICLSMERFARDTLIRDWPSLTEHDRAMCNMEEKISGPPSYIGWLTCLEINANARSPEANSSGSAGATGGEATPKRHDRIHRGH